MKTLLTASVVALMAAVPAAAVLVDVGVDQGPVNSREGDMSGAGAVFAKPGDSTGLALFGTDTRRPGFTDAEYTFTLEELVAVIRPADRSRVVGFYTASFDGAGNLTATEISGSMEFTQADNTRLFDAFLFEITLGGPIVINNNPQSPGTRTIAGSVNRAQDITLVPLAEVAEPGAIGLLGLGILGLAAARRKKA